MDSLKNPFPTPRLPFYASRGMVATSQPLAAQAGLEILQKGGNAVDAAIAAAACLTVTEPTSNGIGGDAFALVWMQDKLYGLNSSGRAPDSISIEKVKALGFDEMPKQGFLPVTVPGIPGAWAELNKKFGKLSLSDCVAPAVRYARYGFPVSPTVGKFWKIAFNAYGRNKGDEFKHWFETFAPTGRAPNIGEIVKLPDHADTLEKIAGTNGMAFYSGELAKKISDFSKKYAGFINEDDLGNFALDWVDPVSVNYRGVDVWEIPPNGQGLVALIALNILKKFDFPARDSAEAFHLQFEAMKLAFSTGKATITDAEKMHISVQDLLSESFADELREKITAQALDPVAYMPKKGGTVYLATADSVGNMVSFIQSNYMGFGSGLVVPGTGIALQNRGADFSLDPQHANALEGGKRTYHTIIPGFLTKDGKAIGPFGVMGGYMQPQGHVQVVMNMIDFSMNPQAALDAPRWQWTSGRRFEAESHFPKYIAEELVRKGHQISMSLDSAGFGRGQIICRTSDGVLIGGTEFRADGTIAGM